MINDNNIVTDSITLGSLANGGQTCQKKATLYSMQGVEQARDALTQTQTDSCCLRDYMSTHSQARTGLLHAMTTTIE